MSLPRFAVIALSAVALVCGTAQAHAMASDGPRDVIYNGGDLLRCAQLPLLPFPLLALYQHDSDCSHSGVMAVNDK
ncbi:hypothetical protein [Streptomyces lavendofoliae]|uniref:hypothetical protein n=1 Tax=Streptomyces lavendofoliae TaxID=67314 RepID=UPI003D91CDF1